MDKRDEVEPLAHVDFCLYGVIAQNNEQELAAMADAGAVGFKLFMGETTGYIRCPDDGAIFAAMRTCGRLDRVVGVHAGNDHVLQRLGSELKAAGRGWARASARRRWSPTCCSTTRPMRRSAISPKLNPPITARSDVEALWAALGDGAIDCIATDHAPHTAAEQAETDVWRAPGGFIGAETMLPLLLTEVAKGALTVSDVVRLTSEAPARLHGLYPRKRSLGIGAMPISCSSISSGPARSTRARSTSSTT